MSELDSRCQTESARRFGASFEEAIALPILKYTGFALLLAWHYVLWFVPQAFLEVELLDDRVTSAWLVNLVATAFFLAVIAVLLGRKRHLSTNKWLVYAAPMATSALTVLLCTVSISFATPLVTLSIAFLLGATEAVQWVLWGERFACVKARFSIVHIGGAFGLALLICVTAALLMPPVVATIFAALLPLASGALLAHARKDENTAFPPLLPKSTGTSSLKNMAVVCGISFGASAACYFLAAIIPWEMLPSLDESFTLGIIGGAITMLILAALCVLRKGKINIFRIYPWLLVLGVVAISLFLADEALYFPAFLMAVGSSAIFEILLIMYFGILTSKGYVTPAIAFGLSGSCIRAGIAAGNSLAILYEKNPEIGQAITPETCLAFLCLLAALLIPLVRKEYDLLKLMTEPASQSQVDTICEETAAEYGLSSREKEILMLIARGYVTNNIAEKLVISPYTVNTHIRHIYEKMNIHKRSELLNYLNMQRSDF